MMWNTPGSTLATTCSTLLGPWTVDTVSPGKTLLASDATPLTIMYSGLPRAPSTGCPQRCGDRGQTPPRRASSARWARTPSECVHTGLSEQRGW
eukprot:4349718-Prymnesium_polylepis.1